MKNIKENILHTLKKNDITMIPRWKFLLYSCFGMIFALFSFLSLVFIISLFVFLLSSYGFVYLPYFGFQEMVHTLASIPFLLVTVAIILVFLTETLARQYTFAYKKPLFATLVSITGLAVLTGFVLSLTPFHHGLRSFARMHNWGGVIHIYDRPVPFQKNEDLTVVRGLVVSTTTAHLVVRLYDESQITVEGTTTDEKNEHPEFNDQVVMLGKMENGVFEALQIRILPPTDDPFDPRNIKKSDLRMR